MTVRRLDTLLAEDVQIMKIDVEGFEVEVLTGAEELFSKYEVRYIMTECNVGIIGDEGKKKYLK
jgi:FkbM family methyltransferase